MRRAVVALAALALARTAAAGMVVDAGAELTRIAEGQPVAQHIRDARHRVAVFTFEDPDRTGLGDLAAALVAERIVSGAYVRSLGVIRYTGRLTPPPDERGPSYFDRVDKLAAAQKVELSIWGSIRKTPGSLRIDTYLQIHDDSAPGLSWNLQLAGCGDEMLRARLRPTRILLARVDLDAIQTAALATRLVELDKVRTDPSPGAPILCTLAHDQVHSYGTIDSGWAPVLGCSRPGWINVRPSCGRGCEVLLQGAEFAGELLRAIAQEGNPPRATPGLSTEALAISDQVAILQSLHTMKLDAGLDLAERWAGGDRPPGIPPGGATFANHRMCLRMARHQGPDRSHPRPAPPQTLLDEADALARALQSDPQNPEVLHNLEVLFRCAGDTRRADRAAALPRR